MAIYQVTDRYVQAGAYPWGITRAWTPSFIKTSIWFDAADSDTVTTVSGAVSQWDDKSGNGRHITQSTPANRPTYVTTHFGGLPAVYYDGNAKTLTGSVADSASSSKYLFFVVFNSRTANETPATSRQLYFQESLGTLLAQLRTTGEQPTFYYNPAWYGPTNGGATGEQILIFDLDTDNQAIYRNGTSIFTQSVTAPSRDMDGNFWVGSSSSLGASSIHAELAEFGVIQDAGSSLLRERLEGYLAHKWGKAANLPSAHPYKTSAPTI